MPVRLGFRAVESRSQTRVGLRLSSLHDKPPLSSLEHLLQLKSKRHFHSATSRSSCSFSFITGMPDLNSVPPSPHSLAASRRQSTNQMAAPPVPPSPSLNILPSNQSAVNQSQSPSLPSPVLTASQPPSHASIVPGSAGEHGVGPGPGPLRHPRPLTAAELHLQLEKEQEAVVSREQYASYTSSI